VVRSVRRSPVRSTQATRFIIHLNGQAIHPKRCVPRAAADRHVELGQTLSGFFDIRLLLRIWVLACAGRSGGLGPEDGADDLHCRPCLLMRGRLGFGVNFVSSIWSSAACGRSDTFLVALDTFAEWMGRRKVLSRPSAGMLSSSLDIRLLLESMMVSSSVGCASRDTVLLWRGRDESFAADLETFNDRTGLRIERAFGRLPLSPSPFDDLQDRDISDLNRFRSSLDLAFLP